MAKRPTSSLNQHSRYIKPSVRRAVIQKAGGCCEYRDPKTGVVCGSKVQIEIDHIRPFGMGGTSEPDNLRLLCRQHNQFMARFAYGQDVTALCRRQ